jgi:hypothetical protein
MTDAHSIATAIRLARFTVADFDLILSAIATKVREDFSRCATDDAVDSLDMAMKHIEELREFSEDEWKAKVLSHYQGELRKARMEASHG